MDVHSHHGPDVAGTAEIRHRLALACDRATARDRSQPCTLIVTPGIQATRTVHPSTIQLRARLRSALDREPSRQHDTRPQHSQTVAAKAPAAASIVCAMSASECAADTNPASYAEGAK